MALKTKVTVFVLPKLYEEYWFYTFLVKNKYFKVCSFTIFIQCITFENKIQTFLHESFMVKVFL